MEKINRKVEELSEIRKLQLRLYKFKKKHVRKDGTVTIGPNRQWKWVKGEMKQRKYRPRGQAKTLYSKRFGYLDTYTYNERKLLICPSGYTFGQGMHALHRLWFAFKISKSEANIDKMVHYARAIQQVQEDMGLKTTSFPHLGLYGDILVLYEHKNQKAVEEDHSELKTSQELLEKKYEIITIADDMNKIFKEEKEQEKEVHSHKVVPVDIPAKVPLLLVPTPEQEIQIFTDDIPFERKPLKSKLKLKLKSEKRKVKHENRIPYKYKDANWKCRKCGEEMVPHTLEAWDAHICKEENKELEIVTLTDDIPFESSQEN